MTDKRFTIKPQDDYFGITDNNTADKVNIINGIRTEIEAEWLCKDMNALNDDNEKLKQSIYIMGGRLQGLWANYYENRWSIWSEVVEDIANELGFKIHHAYDDSISNSESKKERVEGVKKITEILGENELIKQENKELKEKNNILKDYIKKLTNNKGEIILADGRIYKTDIGESDDNTYNK